MLVDAKQDILEIFINMSIAGIVVKSAQLLTWADGSEPCSDMFRLYQH